jgi:hypothetical protein
VPTLAASLHVLLVPIGFTTLFVLFLRLKFMQAHARAVGNFSRLKSASVDLHHPPTGPLSAARLRLVRDYCTTGQEGGARWQACDARGVGRLGVGVLPVPGLELGTAGGFVLWGVLDGNCRSYYPRARCAADPFFESSLKVVLYGVSHYYLLGMYGLVLRPP